jgi:hypothetical protein
MRQTTTVIQKERTAVLDQFSATQNPPSPISGFLSNLHPGPVVRNLGSVVLGWSRTFTVGNMLTRD